MTERIEKCAELVVTLLGEGRSLNILLIPELLGERSVLVYQALGWLAREGKVCYSMKGQQCYLSLAEEAEPGETGEPGGG